MEKSTNNLPLNRRRFLQISGASGALLALGFGTSAITREAEVYKINGEGVFGAQLNPFIIIDPEGKITLMNHKPEMGQGVFQSMPMLLAEELEVNMDDVHIVQAEGHKKYGSQMVGGSNSVRGEWEPLRKMGAAAREMLTQAAAKRWKVDTNDCYAENGKITLKKKNKRKSLTYGELVAEAAKLDVPAEPALKDPKDFKILGQPLPRKDAPMKCNGEAVFGLDMEVPGMLYASVERAPTLHGKVVSYDEAAAKAIPGVKYVVKAERPVFTYNFEGVAVVADSYYAAFQGRKALRVQWDLSGYDEIDSRKIDEGLKSLQSEEGFEHETKGDFADAYEQSAKTLEAEYQLPYLAHSPMEPMNMVAQVKGDQCEIWGPTQSPQWALGDLTQYLGIPEENIKIHVSFLGGGFGRRAFNDFIIEAVSIARQIDEPVKVVWTREDDTQQGPFRPGTMHQLQAGFNEQGAPVALKHKMIGQALAFQWPDADKSKIPGGVMEAINTHYAIPNFTTRYVPYETQIPVLWWRSVYSSTNAFAHESFIDEIAHEAGQDPLQFRKEHLKEQPRFVKVLEMLEEKSDWSEALPEKQGKGVAIAECFGSICGQVAFVERNDTGQLKFKKVIAVIDCGMTVNPDTIRAQTEGNIVMGLTAAIKDPIIFRGGRVMQSNFHNYQMVKMDETPEIEVHIMENQEKPGGVGEPGLPPLAPALANAIFNESGNRIRKLPFRMDKV